MKALSTRSTKSTPGGKWLLPSCRFHRCCRIRSCPGNVGRRPISRGHNLVEHAQVDCQLSAMVRGVQNTAPEYPDSFPSHIKERHHGGPPTFILFCKERKPGFCQRRYTLTIVLDGRRWRQDV